MRARAAGERSLVCTFIWIYSHLDCDYCTYVRVNRNECTNRTLSAHRVSTKLRIHRLWSANRIEQRFAALLGEDVYALA